MVDTYFEGVQYRLPQHPVIGAYVRPKLDYIGKTISLSETTSVLDVGCGNGIFTYYFAARCRGVTGIDRSRNMLLQNPCSKVVQSDASVLPFRGATFDLVFEANLLHHVKNRLSVVKEMARVSRRWVVLIEPNRYNPLMFGFGMVVAAERGLLNSTRKSNLKLLEMAGMKPVSTMITGMISQNNTPEFMLPFLKRFDREIWYGEYVMLIAEKVQAEA